MLIEKKIEKPINTARPMMISNYSNTKVVKKFFLYIFLFVFQHIS